MIIDVDVEFNCDGHEMDDDGRASVPKDAAADDDDCPMNRFCPNKIAADDGGESGRRIVSADCSQRIIFDLQQRWTTETRAMRVVVSKDWPETQNFDPLF